MHEFGICENIVKSALEAYENAGSQAGRLLETRVVAGALRQLVPECMEQAYEILTRDTPVEGSKLRLDILPMLGKCRACGTVSEVLNWEFCCTACQGELYDLQDGMELYLKSIKIDDPREP